jgi:P-type Cu+ transporter
VTGESDLQQMKKGDYLYAGGRQVGRRVGMLVQKPTNHSYLTGLWNHEAFGKPHEQKSRRTIDKISRHFTVVILSIALGAGVFWALVDSTNIWQTVTAVLIVACPCALAMSTPFTNGNVLRVLGRHGLYLKNADVVERMAEVDMLVFDKTGTITLPDGGQVKFVGEATTDELGVMGQLAANSTHPLSKKIHRLTGSLSTMKSVKKFSEIPGQGIEAWVEGREYRIGSSAFVTGRYAEGAEGTTRVYVAIDGENRGHFEVEAAFREGLEDLLDKLSGNYQWMVVSGDNEADKASLEKLFPENTPMLFNRKPEQKLKLIEDLQKEGHKVMMLGDGLNDAGALKISHVGFAVSDDTSAFSPACDGILYGPQLYRLDRFLAMAKGGRKVLLSSFGLSFLYNVVGLSFAVAAKLTPLFAAVLMPLSSITIVTFATVSVHLMGKTKKL